jgi:uncharacterized protein YkwD
MPECLRRLVCSLGLAIALVALSVAALPTTPVRAAANPTIRLVQLVNHERARYGLRPLAINYSLMDSAQSYTEVMAGTNCFSHYCRPVPSPNDRARRAGYRGRYYVGENIAYGVTTAEAVFRMWMNSYGHRANILNAAWTEIGIGVASNRRTTYWTQQFGAG